MSVPRSGPSRYFSPAAIPPILLLSVVTSLAFNHAMICTERKQEERLHRVQVQILYDVLQFRARQLYHLKPPNSMISGQMKIEQDGGSKGILSWFGSGRTQQLGEEKDRLKDKQKLSIPLCDDDADQDVNHQEELKEEEESLIRRLSSIGLDPIAYGLGSPTPSSAANIPSDSNPGSASSSGSWFGKSASHHKVGPREITWSEIFFGSKQDKKDGKSSLSENWNKVGAGIRETFSVLRAGGGADTTNSAEQRMTEKEKEELRRIESEWQAMLEKESEK